MRIASSTYIISSSSYRDCESIYFERMMSDIMGKVVTVLGYESIGCGYLLESEESLPDRSRVSLVKNREDFFFEERTQVILLEIIFSDDDRSFLFTEHIGIEA